jgi:hypothetical protein
MLLSLFGLGLILLGAILFCLAQRSGLLIAMLGGLCVTVLVGRAIGDELTAMKDQQGRLARQCRETGAPYLDCLASVIAAQRGETGRVASFAAVPKTWPQGKT